MAELKEKVNELKEQIGEKISPEDIMKALDACYEKCISGKGKLVPSVDKLSNDYLSKYPDPEIAVKNMQRFQIAKCTTSGILTGFGGIVTLPVAIPANIGSVLYVQMRMIACTAKMAGYDLDSDQVQTLVYACLAGISVNEIFKGFGVKFGEKFAVAAIKKIPGEVLIKINQRVGFRLFTKFGEKGLINLGKLVPGVGAAINGGLDLAETKMIADRAYRLFFKGEANLNDDIDIETVAIECE